MITRAHITRRADVEGIAAQDIERDYILAHAVSAIANYDTADRLVFKGGTSLRLIHFDDFRYSADLDFSVLVGTRDEAVALIGDAFRGRGDVIPQLTLAVGDQLRILYVGPLGRERSVKLDLAANELVVNTERKPMRPIWDDVPAAEVAVYTLLEAASEKLRSLLQRSLCRDFYDLYILLCIERVDGQEAVELFRRKARHLNLNPNAFGDRYDQRMSRYEARWATELGNYMREVPPFNEVEMRVKQVLRQANLL